MRHLTVGATVLFLACSSTTEPRLGDEFALRVGDATIVADIGLRVRFVRVAEDSRCPSRVQCVWAGDAAVVVETALGSGDAKPDTLHTNLEPRAVRLAQVELLLVRLDPYPETPTPIPAPKYLLTLATRALP